MTARLFLRTICAAFVALVLTAAPVGAQTNYFWNAPTGGTETWDTATQRWSTTTGGPVDYTWTNSGLEIANFGNSAGTVTLGTGITTFGVNFSVSGYTITGNTLTLAGAGGVIDTGAFDATVNSIIAGGVGLTKNGTGTLILGGANTYTGATNISAGTLRITNSAGLGATGAGNDTVVSSGAALGVSGGLIITEALTLNGTGISNGGALRNYSGDNSYRGGILLGTGGARINSDAGELTITTLPITGSGQPLTIGGAGNVLIGGGFPNILGTVDGSLTKDGSGILTIGNTNSWTGALTINGGVVSYGAVGNLGTNGTVTLDGGTLRNTNLTSGNTFLNSTRTIAIGSNGGTVETPTFNVALIYQGTITGPGNTLTKVGLGEFRVQGATLANFTFSKLVVNQGLYRIGNAAGSSEVGFGAVPGSPLADAITLNGGGIGTSLGLTLNANRGITLGAAGGTINVTTGALTIPSVITGSGNLTVLGDAETDVLTISGANNYTGATTITTSRLTTAAPNTLPSATAVTVGSGATLNLGANSQTIGSLAGAGNLTRTSAALTSGGNDTSTSYSGVINGSGAVTKAGVGTWTISGANTYSGATNIDGGILATGAVNTLPSGTAVTVNAGGALNLNNNSQTIASLAGAGNVDLGSGAGATLTLGNAAATTYSGSISGAGGLTKIGAGTQTLAGANSYTGATTIDAGTLSVNGSLAAGSAVTVNNGGTLAGTGTVNGTVTVNQNASLAPGVAGAGILTIGGNTVIHTFGVSGPGELAISAGAPGSNTGLTMVGGATLDFKTGSVLDLSLVSGFGAAGSYTIVNMPAGAGANVLVDAAPTTNGQVLGTYIQGAGASGPVTIVPSGFALSDGNTFVLSRIGDTVTIDFTPVPEPTTILGLAVGSLAMGGFIRRRVRGRQL
jgi:fibronectin-binding autotransporter adhesin